MNCPWCSNQLCLSIVNHELVEYCPNCKVSWKTDRTNNTSSTQDFLTNTTDKILNAIKEASTPKELISKITAIIS